MNVLEKEIANALKNYDGTAVYSKEQMKDFARHFAEWGFKTAQEELMKNAKSGWVVRDSWDLNLVFFHDKPYKANNLIIGRKAWVVPENWVKEKITTDDEPKEYKLLMVSASK